MAAIFVGERDGRGGGGGVTGNRGELEESFFGTREGWRHDVEGMSGGFGEGRTRRGGGSLELEMGAASLARGRLSRWRGD